MGGLYFYRFLCNMLSGCICNKICFASWLQYPVQKAVMSEQEVVAKTGDCTQSVIASDPIAPDSSSAWVAQAEPAGPMRQVSLLIFIPC